MPDSPPAVLPHELDGPSDFNIWYTRSMRQTGFNAGWPPEPQALVDHDAVLFTHNTGAASSRDSGVDWTRVAPETLFPNSDGGFAGDQRLVRSHAAPNLCFWMLQYGYSPVSQVGRHRLAIARGRDDIKLNRYYYYDFLPTDFGFPTGLWFDFPDLACSNEFLYASTNIYRGSDGGFAGALIWRVRLSELATAGTITFQWYTNAALGGSTYRLTQNATGTMWAATRWNANTLRLYWWPDNATLGFADRTVANTSTGPVSAPGPDLRDWAGGCDHRILGGYVAGTEVGFAYSSAPLPGRPRGFVRLTVFDAGTQGVAYEEDYWHSSATILYPAVSRNAFNHKAMVFTAGGGGYYPSTMVTLNDADSPGWSGGAAYFLSQGDTGPSTNRWGDYVGVTFHPLHPATFVAPAHSQQGGPNPGNIDSRFVWFGRERYTPRWVDVTVAASAHGQPIPVPITIVQTDRSLARNGTTPFVRSYAPSQEFTAIAPLNLNIAGARYEFVDWSFAGQTRPAGQATLQVGDIGLAATTAHAQYVRVWQLDVDSTPAGALVAVDVPDQIGRTAGTAPFERFYPQGTRVTLIAPPTLGNRFLTRWFVNGVPRTPSQQTLVLDITADVRAVADYTGIPGNGVEWTPITRSQTRPSARRDHAMVFDRNTGRVVLFGGETTLANLVNDTWELRDDQWTRLTPANSPSPRFAPAAAYDPIRASTVLFGGGQYLGGRLGDTWTFDGVDWTLQTTTNSPSARHSAAATFDWLNSRVLMFGGVGQGNTRLADTWAYDGTDWTQLSPTNSPPALDRPSMDYDRTTGTVVMTGRDLITSTYQLWDFDGITWTRLPLASAPAARSATPLVYDPHRDRFVSFGGMLSGTAVAEGGALEWDRTGIVERNTRLTPAARGRHGFVWDEWRVRMVLFGGQSAAGTLLDDTWEYEFDCDAVAPGHPGGGLDMLCTSPPRLGGTLTLQFDSPTGNASVFFGFVGLRVPPLPLGPPLLCDAGFVNVTPDVVLAAPGSPASLNAVVPNDPALAFRVLAVQGVSAASTGCLRLTRGTVLALRP